MAEMSNQTFLTWIPSIYSLMRALPSVFSLSPSNHFFFQTGLLNGKELRATILKGKIYNINTH